MFWVYKLISIQTTWNVALYNLLLWELKGVWCKLTSARKYSWPSSLLSMRTSWTVSACWSHHVCVHTHTHTHTHTVWSCSCDLGVARERPSQWPHYLLPLHEGISHCYHGDRWCDCHGDNNAHTAYIQAYICLLQTKVVHINKTANNYQ